MRYVTGLSKKLWPSTVPSCTQISRSKMVVPAPCTSKIAAQDNTKAYRRLWGAAFICMLLMLAEFIGGYYAKSLSVMTDAAHMLTDLIAFVISLVSMWLANRPPSTKLSFGFHRAEIIGSLLSAIVIWILTGALVYEASQRLAKPEKVNGKLMFIIAASGLAANLIMGMILWQSGHGHSHGLGGGHGHSHGEAHGHSHAENHGHAHDGKQTSAENHGHSHDGNSNHDGDSNHGHSHNGNDHGHSHDGNDHGHSHDGNHGHEVQSEKKLGLNFPSPTGGPLSPVEGDPQDLDRECKEEAEPLTEHRGDVEPQVHFRGHHDVRVAVQDDDTNKPKKKEHSHSINVYSAFIHVLGDALQSVGVMIAGAIIWAKPEAYQADTYCTFIFCIIVLFTTLRLIKQCIVILMEAIPEGLDPHSLEKHLLAIQGVIHVHDLHVWALTAGKNAMSAHLVITGNRDTAGAVQEATKLCSSQFSIAHTTFQVERADDAFECNPHSDKVA